jgi:DNA-binding winged helix-turn-helix (wHTH) protein/uncharacterized DUF497 family protein
LTGLLLTYRVRLLVNSSSQSPQGLRFGIFEIDLDARELRKNGLRVRLQDQPFKILAAMARRAGEVIPREELYSELSSHSSYDFKHGLNNAIQKIREVLGDSPENARFIETVPNRGYRFLPPVQFTSQSAANGNCRISPWEDPFLLAIREIRHELLSTSSGRKLNELLHRVNGLINQHRLHPNKYEADVLLGKIQSAIDHSIRSEQNRVKHRISFETAAGVFDDTWALNRFVEPGESWQTLGQVWRTLGPFRKSELIIVSHYSLRKENGEEDIQIKSARKATLHERNAYEQNRKKAGQ